MKSVLTILLILGFIGITIFGFAIMHYGNGYGSGNCIAAIILGTDCPRANDALAFATFHINALNFFTTAVFGLSSFANILLIFLALIIFLRFGLIFNQSLVLAKNAFQASYSRFFEFHLFFRKEIIRRFTLLNKRNPHVLRGVHGLT